MFGLGATELMVVALLLVLLFPPRELPKIARSVARTYGKLRKTADDFRSAVMLDDELQAPIREIRSVYQEARFEIQKSQARVRQELDQVSRDVAASVSDDDVEASTGSEDALPGDPEVSAESEAEDVDASEHRVDQEGHPRAPRVEPLDSQAVGTDAANVSDGIRDSEEGDGASPSPPPRPPKLRAPAGRVPQGDRRPAAVAADAAATASSGGSGPGRVPVATAPRSLNSGVSVTEIEARETPASPAASEGSS